ncbi:MAG: hypothetical protein HDR87_02575 [Bacteroides sp.]|nr:hypothetical protein [Bacteroides sp.]
MKKIYTLLTLFVASLLGLAAQAETRTVTFHVDDPASLKNQQVECKVGSDYIPYSFDENNSLEIVFGRVNDEPVKDLYVAAADGYQITSVKLADGSSPTTSYVTFPTSDVTINCFDSGYDEFLINDGDEIFIETQKAQQKIFTFKANPEHFSKILQYTSDTTPSEDGVWTIDVTDTYRAVYFYLKDEYNFSKVIDSTGKEISFNNSYHYFYVSPSDYAASETFTVESYSLNDSRSASVTINIDGNPDDVTLLRAGEEVKLQDVINEVKFNPETENSFILRHRVYRSKRLYKVTLDDQEIEPEGDYSEFAFNPVDGSVVEVTVESDINVPVKFEFTNKGTEGALSRITCNGVEYTNEQCLEDGFSLKLFSTFYVECNEAEFDIEGVYCNGEYGFTGTIMTEDEYVVTITATTPQLKEFTIKCDAWEHVSIEDNRYDAVTLTGSETTIKKRELPEYLKVKVLDGYMMNSITDEATGESLAEDYYGTFWVEGIKEGMTIVIDANEFVRDQEMVIYLEDAEWARQDISLNDWTSFEKRISVDKGYNHVMFGEGDFANAVFLVEPLEGTPVMYLNDEKVEMEEDSWGGLVPVGLDKIKAGDVLKIYSEEKATHTVTYQIAADVNAEVYHDHIVAIDSPASHSLLPGTEIHIKPAATKTRSAVSGLIVKVNDQVVEPAEDGVYTITTDGDKTINIANDPTSSISEITADENVKSYDLMGRRVSANHRGLTIINGRKVMK